MVTVPPALADSWAFFVHLAVVLVPLFVGASFLVRLAEEYLPPAAVERRLRGHDEGVGNVVAAGVGAVTPFCSCSTVPVLSGLLGAGAPLGLAFSFLLASPLVNEIAILLLLGLFGPVPTALYVGTTFLAAVVGGIVIGRLGLEAGVRPIGEREAVATDGGTAAGDADADAGCGCGCGPESGTDGPVDRTHRERLVRAALGTRSFLTDMLPYLVVGMVAGALIHGVVPVSVVRALLGPENPLAVPLAAVAGAPIYVSMRGMLPIAASLGEKGVPLGTVLAFVVGGAGVSVPNLVLLSRLFERRLLAVYAGTVVTVGVVVGLLVNTVV